METRSTTEWPKGILYAVAALSALSALIHFWVMPEHFGEWWGYGAFFLLAASAQLLYAALLLLLRTPGPSVLVVGIAGNSAIVLLYLLTRVVGIPLFGPEAWEVEKVGAIDACATASEVAIVVALGALVLWRPVREGIARMVVLSAVLVLLVSHLPHLLLLFLLLYRLLS